MSTKTSTAKKITPEKTQAKKSVKKAPAKKSPATKTTSKDPIKIEFTKPEILQGCTVLHNGKKIHVNAISLSAGATVNTGDFNNAKFNCMITLSGMDSDVSLEEMTEFGWSYLRDELGRKIKSVREKTGGE